jgi:EmrB/QacA subfamily drug resistance transporter
MPTMLRAPAPATTEISQARRWLVLVAMTGSLSMILLDQTVTTVALPSMSRELSLGSAGQQWVVNSYVLAMAALVAVGGKLGDVLGRVTTFRLGVAIFFLSSALCGLVPSGNHAEAVLVAARVAQGVGAALMMPVSAAIVMAAFPAGERGRVMALYAGISQVFLALGPLVGGFLTQYVSWRAVFWLNVPVGVASLVLVRLAAPANPRLAGSRLRMRDVVLMALSTGGVVFAVQQSSDWGWGAPSILLPLAAGLLGGALFVGGQLRSADPLVDLRLLANRAFLGDGAVMALVQFGMIGATLFASLYGQDLMGFSPARAGLNALPMILPLTVSAQLGGRWFDRAGARRPALTGLSITVIGLVLWTASLPHLTYWWQLPGMALAGFGIGLIISPTNTDALSRVESSRRGQASGLVQTLRQLGSTLGVAVIGTVVVHRTTSGPAAGSPRQAAFHAADAIAWGFGVAATAFALALVVGWWLLVGKDERADTVSA